MIRGCHTMLYSDKAPELREFLRDKLGFPATDVGGGWLIMELPEADMGVHPTEVGHSAPNGTHDISFYCDDIEATKADLESRGVEFTKPVANMGFGLAAFFKVPGDFEMMLYQPLYKK